MSKVTAQDLRKMEVGRPYVFKLDSARAINSAKAHAYNMQHELGCRFSAVSDYHDLTLTLTKNPK